MSSHSDDEVHVDNDGNVVDYRDYFKTDRLFAKYKDALNWAKPIALKIGFELIIAGHKSNHEFDRRITFSCSRGYKGSTNDDSSSSRPNTKTKYCKCPFRFVTQWCPVSGAFFIRFFNSVESGTHNHSFIVYEIGHRQHSGLSGDANELLRNMSNAQAKPSNIWAALVENYPEDNPTINQVYNARAKNKRIESAGRTMVEQLVSLANDCNYMYWLQRDPETSVLTHAFMAHPDCINLLRTFPFVIGVDSTYKTNRYKYPLVELIGMTSTNKNFVAGVAFVRDETEGSYAWVLDKLRLLLGEDLNPNIIVSDRELGLFSPIRDIFPLSAHLLCTWHINKGVEAKVTKLCNNSKEMGERFKNGRWYKILNASTVPIFEYELEEMRLAWAWRPAVFKYIDETWLKHKEKFVKAWTNEVMHFGNVTTCRVESAHASLKTWITTCTGSLDTVFAKLNKHIEGQVRKIKVSLEESISKSGKLYMKQPYQYLQGRVSLYCMELLADEVKRMRELGESVNEMCGCVYQATHGIPCACQLYTVMESGQGVYVKHVHPFWRTLIIGMPAFREPSTDPIAEEWKYIDQTYAKIREGDITRGRELNAFMWGTLSQQSDQINEPTVVEQTKGRPPISKKGKTSSKRDPSGFEYVSANSGQVPMSTGTKSRMSCSSSKGVDQQTPCAANRTSYKDFKHFGKNNKNRLPSLILKFVTGYVPIIGDGNCGFRVVADAFHGSQDNWILARRSMFCEISMNANVYEWVYGVRDVGLGNVLSRIQWENTQGSAPRAHWMEVHSDLYPIANFYNCVVFYFHTVGGQHNVSQSTTILPWRASPDIAGPFHELALTFFDDHFTRLIVSPDCPVPPISTYWANICNDSVSGWEQFYAARIKKWNDKYQ